MPPATATTVSTRYSTSDEPSARPHTIPSARAPPTASHARRAGDISLHVTYRTRGNLRPARRGGKRQVGRHAHGQASRRVHRDAPEADAESMAVAGSLSHVRFTVLAALAAALLVLAAGAPCAHAQQP